MNSTSLFDGTAERYRRHRLPYPEALIDDLVERFALADGGRVLDIGCGPGTLTQRLAARGVKVVGIEPNADMLRTAADTLSGAGLEVPLVCKTAEDVGPQDGPARLALFGRSFHWTDRDRVLRQLDAVIEPTGGIVVVHEDTESRLATAVGRIIEALKRDWCPDGIPNADNRSRHDDHLAASAFAAVETRYYPVVRRWTIDDVLGHMLSTSYFNPQALGARAAMFDIDARNRLLMAEPKGLFIDEVKFRALFAVRSGAPTG